VPHGRWIFLARGQDPELLGSSQSVRRVSWVCSQREGRVCKTHVLETFLTEDGVQQPGNGIVISHNVLYDVQMASSAALNKSCKRNHD